MGSIPANQLGMAMRLAGQAPTEVQVSQILTELDRLSRTYLNKLFHVI